MAVGDDTYSPEIAAEICRRLSEGEALTEICRTKGYPSKAVIFNWQTADINGFADQYAEARKVGWFGIAEEMLELSDNGSNDWMLRNDPDNAGWQFNGEHYQRSRLRLDTRKWLLSKMLPKIYGDRQHVEVDAKVRTTTQLSDEQALEEIAALSAQLGGKVRLVVVDEEDDE
jgi:hypothetical protein